MDDKVHDAHHHHKVQQAQEFVNDAKAKPATPTTATTVAASQTDADVDSEWMDAIKNVIGHFTGANQHTKENTKEIQKGKKHVL